MDFVRPAVVALLAGAVGCSSSSAAPSSQDSGSDGPGLVQSGEGGPSDASPADATATADAEGDAGGDATLHEITCTERPPAWDHHLPDGALCSDLSADTDHDGTPDCLDGCPYDPQKIAPGACGCNIPDVDTDGDGVPDCNDLCPYDPNNTAVNQCGCVHSVVLEPAGTACTDTACAQADASCNAVGVCGDRSVCPPCPGGHFVQSNEDVGYWFCGGSLPAVEGPGCVVEDGGEGAGATRMAAQAACASKGMQLARIESITENDYIAKFITTRVWIGANDLQTPGQWYWSSPTTDSDALFWSGGADGGQQNSLFWNWASGAPGSSGACASMSATNGTWSDTDCTQTLGYVCSFRAPLK
jgi:hypothetical protein